MNGVEDPSGSLPHLECVLTGLGTARQSVRKGGLMNANKWLTRTRERTAVSVVNPLSTMYQRVMKGGRGRKARGAEKE